MFFFSAANYIFKGNFIVPGTCFIIDIADLKFGSLKPTQVGQAMCKTIFDVTALDMIKNYGAVIAGFDLK